MLQYIIFVQFILSFCTAGESRHVPAVSIPVPPGDKTEIVLPQIKRADSVTLVLGDQTSYAQLYDTVERYIEELFKRTMFLQHQNTKVCLGTGKFLLDLPASVPDTTSTKKLATDGLLSIQAIPSNAEREAYICVYWKIKGIQAVPTKEQLQEWSDFLSKHHGERVAFMFSAQENTPVGQIIDYIKRIPDNIRIVGVSFFSPHAGTPCDVDIPAGDTMSMDPRR